MPYDQLLLPLLGGYIFVRHFNRTAYACSSYSGHKLILTSALAGVGLVLASAVIIHLIGLSSDSDVFHTIVVAPAIVGLVLLSFGSWKTAKAARAATTSYETDIDEDYSRREARRRKTRIFSLTLFLLANASLIAVALHTYATWSVLQLTRTFLAAITWILVGFWVVTIIKRKSEMEGHKVALILGSVVVVAFVIFLAAFKSQGYIESTWKQIVPFDYAGTAVLALLLGIAAIWPCNLLYPYETAINRLFENRMLDGIESLFYYAGITVQQIMITMTDNKVYTGYVDGEIPIAGLADNYVTLIPLSSGYRDPQTRRVTITTEYTEPMEIAILKKDIGLIPIDTAKVIPVDEIITAGIFDPDLYEEFKNASPRRLKRFGPRNGPRLHGRWT